MTLIWGILAPWLGPVLLVLRPWLARLRGAGASASGYAGPVLIAVAIGAVGVGIWRIWASPSHKAVAAEAKIACDAANTRAELAATKSALGMREATLAERDRQLQSAEALIGELENDAKKLRERAPGAADPVFAADDPWLRSGASGRRAQSAGGR